MQHILILFLFFSFCISSLQVAKIRVRIGEWDFSTTSEVHPHIERKVLTLKKKLYGKRYMHGGNYNWILNSKFGSRNCLAAKDVACNYDGKKSA